MAEDLTTRATAVLRHMVGDRAEFRPGQLEAIAALVDERRRVLCVQRTGWGKSAVYFVGTRLLRDAGAGPTLLVSPLLALMRDQIEQAARGGVRARTINSDNRDEWDAINAAIEDDEIDLLLVSPERFANAGFRSDVLPMLASRVGLFVIDEAHCISDWGHDFRPDYRRLARVLDLLPSGVPVLCTTATANDRVVDDVREQLGDDLLVIRGPLDREALALDVVELPSQPQRLAWLAEVIPQLDGAGIVYTLTVRDCLLVTEWLQSRGIAAEAYFGGENSEAKVAIEARLKANDVKVVVATSALGMGYDKPDLAFVVHFQSPGSAVAYYQQVGRAGRGIARAFGILLAGNEDAQIQDWFIQTAFPRQDDVDAVIAHLEDSDDGASIVQLERAVNLRRNRIQHLLKQLEVEGVVEKKGPKYSRTLRAWSYPTDRIERITARRRDEQARMRAYLAGDGCLMQHLRRELDDGDAPACGRCGPCLGAPLVAVGDLTSIAREAVQFIRGHEVEIEPRKRWADNTNVAPALRAEPGIALCRYGDGGWGTTVREQRAAGEFGDELVDALARLVRASRLDSPPRWVTAVPSLRAPELVDGFARRVAVALGLEYRPVVAAVREKPAQRSMENSAQQAGNVDGAFVVKGTVPESPVLLIDDFVDSRWTVTMIAAALRDAGSGPVFPVALAVATGD